MEFFQELRIIDFFQYLITVTLILAIFWEGHDTQLDTESVKHEHFCHCENLA